MTKAKKNSATCRLAIGDRVKIYGNRLGTLTQKRRGYGAFGVTIDGQTFVMWYYRDQLTWIDTTPAEPEPYEAWFVA